MARRLLAFVAVVVALMSAADAASARMWACSRPSGPPVSRAEYAQRARAAYQTISNAGKLFLQITPRSSREHVRKVYLRVWTADHRGCNAMGRIQPPTQIASLHRSAYNAMRGLTAAAYDASHAVQDAYWHDYGVAVRLIRHYSERLDVLGRQLAARGY